MQNPDKDPAISEFLDRMNPFKNPPTKREIWSVAAAAGIAFLAGAALLKTEDSDSNAPTVSAHAPERYGVTPEQMGMSKVLWKYTEECNDGIRELPDIATCAHERFEQDYGRPFNTALDM